MGKESVFEISDFNFRTFKNQIHYLRENNSPREGFSYIVTLYNIIAQNYNPNLFAEVGIDSCCFARNDLAQLLYQGYKLLAYNPYSNTPVEDKLILCFSNDEETNTSAYATKTKSIDFSTISNTRNRNLLKDFFWNASPSLNIKIAMVRNCSFFFQFLDDIEAKRITPIFKEDENPYIITPNIAFAYMMYLRSRYNKTNTVYKYIFDVKQVLLFAINSDGYEWIDPHAIEYFKSAIFHCSDTNPPTDEEIEKLCPVINEKSKVSKQNFMFSIIFYLLIMTKFRLSEILNLNADCVVETLKRNEFILISYRKSSNGQKENSPITTYTKKKIDHLLDLTNEWREDCQSPALKNKLFLVPGHRTNTYRKINKDSFNKFLENCCKEANIPVFSASNLRDLHMTKAQEYRLREGLSDIQETVITGHSSTHISSKYYVKVDIKKMLEVTHGIILGDIEIEGEIKESSSLSEDALVYHRCGHCKSSSCNMHSYLECLMCEDFIATIDRIPFFLQEIKRIDSLIEYATIPHDIDDLNKIKELLCNYLGRLISLKEDLSCSQQ